MKESITQEERRARRAAYIRAYKTKYRAEHREEMNAYSREYYAKHQKKAKAKYARYRAKNREKLNAKSREYRAEHQEEVNIRGRKYYAEHLEKEHAKGAKWRTEHPGKARAYHIKSFYNLTIKDYDKLLAFQNGRCAVCYSLPNGRRLSVDHDHATGEIRGLLCQNCNFMLGFANDSIDLLATAINYLERFADSRTVKG